jgi:hypothetical protein
MNASYGYVVTDGPVVGFHVEYGKDTMVDFVVVQFNVHRSFATGYYIDLDIYQTNRKTSAHKHLTHLSQLQWRKPNYFFLSFNSGSRDGFGIMEEEKSQLVFHDLGLIMWHIVFMLALAGFNL